MKFCWSTLSVKSMDESLAFYQDIVGLKIIRRFPAGPGMEIAFVSDGQTELELIYNGADKEVQIGQDISWGFAVDSIDKTLELVKEKGIQIHSGPFQPNPHTKFFFVLDPNGLKIQFVENM